MTILAGSTVIIVLHGLAGVEISVNALSITSMRTAPPSNSNKHFTEGVHCMVSTSDGKYVTVTETCDEVRRAIEQTKHR
jgi:uncharacterized protein YlzI (FlbEa/FlbD family)